MLWTSAGSQIAGSGGGTMEVGRTTPSGMGRLRCGEFSAAALH